MPKKIGDQSIDMILCDLPYGSTILSWDSIIPLDRLWDEYNRIIKPGGAIVLTATQPFASLVINSNIQNFKHEWIWWKNRGSNFASVRYQPFREHEHVLVFCKGSPNYYPIKEERTESGKSRVKHDFTPIVTSKTYQKSFFGKERRMLEYLRYPSSIQKFNVEVGLHPTQKPLTLFRYLIKTYTKINDTVMDNCFGSGTSALASKLEKRNFIGIEKEKSYFDIAINRVQNA